jgi:hypothetical protein
MDFQASRERGQTVAARVKELVDGQEADVVEVVAYEQKPGLFRAEVRTAKGQPDRVGLFRLSDSGEVSPA